MTKLRLSAQGPISPVPVGDAMPMLMLMLMPMLMPMPTLSRVLRKGRGWSGRYRGNCCMLDILRGARAMMLTRCAWFGRHDANDVTERGPWRSTYP